MKWIFFTCFLFVVTFCHTDADKRGFPDATFSLQQYPTSVQASVVSPFNVHLSWVVGSSTIGGCIVVERRQREDDEFRRLVYLSYRKTDYLDFGLNPDTGYWYRVGFVKGCMRNFASAGVLYSEEVYVKTISSELPRLSVEVNDDQLLCDGYTIFSIEDPDNLDDFSALVATDIDGQYVWMLGDGRGAVITDFDLIEGRGFVILKGMDIEIVSLWNERLFRFGQKLFHHDVDISPWGTVIGVFAYPHLASSGQMETADAVMELQVPSGKVLFSADVKNFIPNGEFCPICYSGGEEYFWGHDWTHVNAVELSSDFNRIYLSVRNLNRIYSLSYPDGGVEWIMGDGGDFGEGLFYHQHAPHFIDGSKVVVFDNGLHRPDGKLKSRVVEIAFDSTSSIAKIVWEYDEGGSLYSEIGGDAALMWCGNFLITDSVGGRIFEVSPQKEKLWELKLPFPFRIYKAVRVKALPAGEK